MSKQLDHFYILNSNNIFLQKNITDIVRSLNFKPWRQELAFKDVLELNAHVAIMRNANYGHAYLLVWNQSPQSSCDNINTANIYSASLVKYHTMINLIYKFNT